MDKDITHLLNNRIKEVAQAVNQMAVSMEDANRAILFLHSCFQAIDTKYQLKKTKKWKKEI